MKIVGTDFHGTYDKYPDLVIDMVITGETWEKYDEFMRDWTDEAIPIFFNPNPKPDLMNIVTHKAKVINDAGVTEYYEDQKVQVDLLKALCPKTKITLVK